MNSALIKLIISLKIQILFICLLKTLSYGAPPDKTVDWIIVNSINEYKKVNDITFRLDKTVNKNDRIYIDLNILGKFKKPCSYYFRWQEGRFKGQEVIYVEGSNNDKIVAHTGGILRFLTLSIAPDGAMAMKRNHHSLRESGMDKIMKIIEDDFNRWKQNDTGIIRLAEEQIIDKRDVWVIHCEFPKNSDFYARKIILYIDKEIKLPIKITAFDWNESLFEEYFFRDLRINTGIGETDFDPGNPEYNFLWR